MEESVESLRARLREEMRKIPMGKLGSLSLSQSRALKDLWMAAERAANSSRSSAATLRSLINEVRVFQ